MIAGQESLTFADSADPSELVDEVLRGNHGRACITNSFQAEDLVVLHFLRQRIPDVPVLFLETGYHFEETYAFRDRLAREWQLNLVNVLPKQTVSKQELAHGILYQSDPAQCCRLRKVEPLMQALDNFEVWFTGLRREQSPTRKNLKIVEHHELPTGKTILKVSPLAAWDWKQVWQYTVANNIDYLPALRPEAIAASAQPCTSIPLEGADPRSGRWGGSKLECGIHTFSKRAE